MKTTLWVVGAFIAAIAVLSFAGCEPKVVSPFSGQQVNAGQLVNEANQQARKLEAEARAEADTKKAQLAKLQRETRAKIVRVSSMSQQQIEELTANVDAAVQDVQNEVARISSNLQNAIKTVDEQTQSGLQEIERKREAMGAVVRILNNVPGLNAAVASTTGSGLNDFLLPLLALGGVAYGAKKSGDVGKARADEVKAAKAAEDKGWDEAMKEAAAMQAKLDAVWEEATNRAKGNV